jgi:hypothetical protein
MYQLEGGTLGRDVRQDISQSPVTYPSLSFFHLTNIKFEDLRSLELGFDIGRTGDGFVFFLVFVQLHLKLNDLYRITNKVRFLAQRFEARNSPFRTCL